MVGVSTTKITFKSRFTLPGGCVMLTNIYELKLTNVCKQFRLSFNQKLL